MGDPVSEVIARIGAKHPKEKEAWRKVIEGVVTILYFQLQRRVQQRPSYYSGLTEAGIQKRIHDNIVTWMLKITAVINEVRESLDYSGGDA